MITKEKLGEKIFLILHDNVANMIQATHYHYVSLGSAAYTLQLIIKDALFWKEAVRNVIKDCRKIVGHFLHRE